MGIMSMIHPPMWLLQTLIWGFLPPPNRKRDRPLEVLCLGMSRTGTDSLRKALLTLGIDDVYHGWRCVENPNDWGGWFQAYLARRHQGYKEYTAEDYDKIIGDCMAISDVPAIGFAEDFIRLYPEAKVILTHRDVDSWHNSNVVTFETLENNWLSWLSQFFCLSNFIEYNVQQSYMQWWFVGGDLIKCGKWRYREHYAMVKGLVPPEMLLEYHVKDGWEPLCKFLNKPIPDVPMPSGNEMAGFKKRYYNAVQNRIPATIRNVVLFFLLVIAGITWFVKYHLFDTVDWATAKFDVLQNMVNGALVGASGGKEL